MKEETKRLINLLKKGAMDDVIRDILHISNLELLNQIAFLEKEGFHIKKDYHSNAKIKYTAVHNENDIKILNNNDHLHRIRHHQTNFKALIISDIHVGNKEQGIKEIDIAFNYCKRKGINIIFCCGDMIDGTYSRKKQIIEDPYEQIHHFINQYPYDPHILTFAVGGDHDISTLQNYYQDMLEVIKKRRHDIIVDEYGSYPINIKNDQLLLYHHIGQREMSTNNASIIIHGHSHQYGARINSKKVLNIYAPSISRLNKGTPSAIELTINFDNSLFNEVQMKQIEINKKTNILSEENFTLSKKRHRKTL